MFNLAYDMAALPVRLAIRGIRRWWQWRSERRRQGRFGPMAQALGNVTPPLPRVPGLTAKTWAALLAASKLAPDSREAKAATAAVSAEITAAVAGVPALPQAAADPREARVAATADEGAPGEADELPDLAKFQIRHGVGFSVVFHFLLNRQRVRQSVWLHFNKLEWRLGREKAWALRARLGHAQIRHALDRPSHSEGRVELPEVRLALESTRTLKARTFMFDTMDAVNAMIEEGGIGLVSGHFKGLPAGDGPVEPLASGRGKRAARKPAQEAPKPGADAQAPHGQGMTEVSAQSSLPFGVESSASPADGVAPMPPVLPGPGEDAAGLPRGVEPQHVCTGILAGAGVTERTDSSGRAYRIFYADVDVDGRISRQTGADLERALHAANARVGLRVRLQHLGYVPVNAGRHRRKVWHATVLEG